MEHKAAAAQNVMTLVQGDEINAVCAALPLTQDDCGAIGGTGNICLAAAMPVND